MCYSLIVTPSLLALSTFRTKKYNAGVETGAADSLHYNLPHLPPSEFEDTGHIAFAGVRAWLLASIDVNGGVASPRAEIACAAATISADISAVVVIGVYGDRFGRFYSPSTMLGWKSACLSSNLFLSFVHFFLIDATFN
jgi:hypothetical protein